MREILFHKETHSWYISLRLTLSDQSKMERETHIEGEGEIERERERERERQVDRETDRL